MLADGYPGHPFIWDDERRFEIRCELDALYFHLYLGTQSDWGCSSQHSPEAPQSNGSHLSLENGGAASAATTHHSPLTAYFKTPRHLATSPSGHLPLTTNHSPLDPPSRSFLR